MALELHASWQPLLTVGDGTAQGYAEVVAFTVVQPGGLSLPVKLWAALGIGLISFSTSLGVPAPWGINPSPAPRGREEGVLCLYQHKVLIVSTEPHGRGTNTAIASDPQGSPRIYCTFRLGKGMLEPGHPSRPDVSQQLLPLPDWPDTALPAAFPSSAPLIMAQI